MKGYVRNRARAEGCIAKCYLVDECMRFVSGIMKQDFEMDSRQSRNQDFDNDVILEGRPVSKGLSITLANERLQSAHRSVLFNIAELQPYLE